MKSRKTKAMVGMGMSVILMTAGYGYAQGVGNIGSLPTVFTTTPPNGWAVIDPNGTPIPVSLSPTGPVWSKVFAGPNGGPFTYPAGGPPLPVMELLQVSGTIPWTDWHEDVLDPNWTWANPVVLVNGQPASGLTVSGIGTSNLSFFFNPVAPGSVINIRKDLVYNGVPGTAFIGTLPIHEYPTPEPATLGLLALGGLAAMRRRGWNEA